MGIPAGLDAVTMISFLPSIRIFLPLLLLSFHSRGAPAASKRASTVDSAYFLKNFVDHTYRAVINRRVLPPAEGFHLEVLTEVVLSSPLVSSSSSSLNCSLRLTETLPSGLYVDAFQLRNYHQFGGPLVTSQRAVDTEAPAFLSREEPLFVYHPFRVDRQRQRLVSQVVLPVHLRYHRAVEGGESTQVTFQNPLADIACWKKKSDGRRLKDADSWLSFEAEAMTPVVKISVPRGDLSHSLYVIACTFVACSWAVTQLWSAAPIGTDKRND